MKTIVFGDAGLAYRVPDKIYKRYLAALKKGDEAEAKYPHIWHSDEAFQVSAEIQQTCKPIAIDFIATGYHDTILSDY